MKTLLKKIGLNNHSLKILSLVFGYLIWMTLGQIQKITIKVDVPLCFYGLQDNYIIQAPETLKLTLSGKRGDLYNIDLSQAAAVHIDASNYNQVGKYNIAIKNNDIFLHNKIELLNYSPNAIQIQIKEKK